MVTLTERTIIKSRSGVYSDTSENRRKHRVGQKYGAEKQPEDGEKTEKKEADPAKELEAVNKVIAAINEGKLNLPASEVMKLSEKKQKLEAAKKQAEKINSGVKANEEKKNAEEAKETSKKINEAQKKESEKKEKPADELASAREELQRHKDKKDSWIAKYGKNSYETRLQQIKDNVERLKNKERSEKEKRADEKNSKKAAEMKEKVKSDKASDPIYQIQQKKKEAAKKYDDKREEARQKFDKESDEIRSQIDKLYESDHPDAAKKRKELWNSLKEKTNKYDEETTKLKNEYEAEYQKLDEAEDKLYDQRSKEETSENEQTDSYTRIKFEDIPNSGKINLKKYLSEKVRKGVDEKWSSIKKIPTENLKKMEKGLVNDLNKNFEAIKKSQRAELLYSIMKVRGELESRGKESEKTEQRKEKSVDKPEKPKEKSSEKKTEESTKYIVNGSVWGSANEKDGLMNLTVNKDGSVYGYNDKWDFEAKTKEEALQKLKKWGYEYVGIDYD